MDVDLIPPQGTFAVNNADPYTESLSVTLYNAVTGASEMRFGNTTGERDAASWTGYLAIFPRTLG